jgi:flagellar hook-basal body complex protein FliE
MVKDIGSIGKSFFVQQYEKTAGREEASGFKETLRGIADQLGSVQEHNKLTTESVVLGNPVDSHDVMIAAQEASLAFDLILEVRNKLIEAYQEIIRMQI